MSATDRSFALRRVTAPSDAELAELADVLIDCVDGGASVSFMHPFGRDRAPIEDDTLPDPRHLPTAPPD